MFKVGLTGGIGCGKSIVANAFAKLGVPVIDTDKIAHALTAFGGRAIAHLKSEFGNDVLTADGALDRQKMRILVFSDQKLKQRLEAILHPMIRQNVEDLMATFALQKALYCVIDVPLLFESGVWHQRVDRVLVVDCPELVQIERVMARNGWSKNQVEQVMAAQISREKRLMLADDVLDNQGDLLSVTQQVELLHVNYVVLATQIVCKNKY